LGPIQLGLFRLNYVLAGFWAIAILILFHFFFDLIFIAIATLFLKKERLGKRVFQFIGYCFGLFLFSSAALAMAFYLKMSPTGDWIIVGLLGVLGVWGVTKELGEIFKELAERLKSAPDVMIAFLLLTMYLIGFSRTVYSGIPINIGGGKPQLVHIIPNGGSQSQWEYILDRRASQNADSTQNPFLKKLHILLATDDELVFLDPADSTGSVVVRRESVSTILYSQ